MSSARSASYVALLRGINVGPSSQIDMADLRALFTALGHHEVATYIRSGNVVFRTTRVDADEMAKEAEARIAAELGVSSGVVVRSHHDLDGVLGRNPYLGNEDDLAKLHVAFLASAPAQEAVDGLAVPEGEPGRFAVIGREVFLHYPNGAGRTKLGPPFLARLRVTATARNWRTVRKLHELTTE